MTIKHLISPYKPRALQAELSKNASRFAVVICHRRFGKTLWAVNHMIFKALRNDLEEPQYLYVAPTIKQAKKAAWKYIKRYTAFLPDAVIYESELKVDIPIVRKNGQKTTITIYVDGGDKPDQLRGTYYDGIVLDEVAQMPKSVWTEALRPTLSDRQGWAVFIGTPKGKNFFKEVSTYVDNIDLNKYGEWSTSVYKASETGVINERELQSLKITMDPDEFEQEYECSFEAVIPGSYYGRMLQKAKEEGRIGEFNWDPKHPVMTAWDLGGMNDATAIWFYQFINNQIIIIDYYEKSDVTSAHLKAVLSKPYQYKKHILPHDANKRNEATGMTRYEETRVALGNNVAYPLRRLGIQDGINAARSILPICLFNIKKCEKGLEALSYYHSEYVEKHDVMKLEPIHDWSSHASDAFRYLALGSRKGDNTATSKFSFLNKPKVKSYETNWNPLG